MTHTKIGAALLAAESKGYLLHIAMTGRDHEPWACYFVGKSQKDPGGYNCTYHIGYGATIDAAVEKSLADMGWMNKQPSLEDLIG